MFKNLGLQEYFYIGYIYLIILGIISDAIFYGILGVPYLNYVTILDALISPISLLTNNWKLTLFLALVFIFMYYYITRWSFKLYKIFKVKKWYQKIYNIEKLDKIYKDIEEKRNLVQAMLLMFFIMFIAMRLGMGLGIRNKIQTKEVIPNYTITFKDDSVKEIKLIGQNSSYVFYIEKDDKIIAITPIVDNLKQIKRIPKKES